MTRDNDNQPEDATRPLPADAGSSQSIYSTPEEGIELISAFARIRNPAIRAALIELVSRLASAGSN